MLIPFVLSALAVVVVLLIVIALRPSSFTVTRSVVITAPPTRIFAQLEDFHAWAAWSPWERIDPACQRAFSGPVSGVGAGYYWLGNTKVGEGRMTITESRPGEHLGIDIEFIKPFAARNRVMFDLTTADGSSTVSWSMSGKSGFLFKAMGLVMNCDKMIGDQYEQGLAQLKAVSERESAQPIANR